MKKMMLAAAAACALTSGAAMAQQAESPWLVRVRAVHLDSENKDSTGLGLSINNKTIPELDVSYFFTPNIAAELVLTYPQKHDLRSNGAKIGSLKHLPPTLLAQYHFTNFGAFKPYLGAGVNYTVFFNEKAKGGFTDFDLKDSFGFALQAGFDYMIDRNWGFNFDVKKLFLEPKVKVNNGLVAGKVKIDPWLIAAGVTYRF